MGGYEQSWLILLVLDVLDSEYDNRSDRFAFVHQVKSLVDFFELEDMRDHRVDLDFSVHVPVDDLRYIGAAAGTAERGTLPYAAGDELERACRNFLAGFGDPDHYRDAPSAMAGFECLPHHSGIAGAVESEVGAPVSQRDQMLDDIAIDLGWIDEMRHAELAAPGILGIVDVDTDDLVGTNHPGALNDVQSDPSEPEYNHIGARRHLG